MKTAITRALTPALLGIFAALFSLSATATAQTTGKIEGTVVDENGFSLPGVLVTAAGAGVRGESVTDVAGSYGFVGLAPGDYLLRATLPGFDPVERRVSVEAGATETVPFVLEVPLLLDTLSVVADEPRTFARNVVPLPMIRQQSQITSVAAVVDNLPGVSVQEGDTLQVKNHPRTIPHILSRLVEYLAEHREEIELVGKLILVEPDRIRNR